MGSFSSKVNDKDKAILDLKVQRDKLKVYAKKVILTINHRYQSFVSKKLKLQNNNYLKEIRLALLSL